MKIYHSFGLLLTLCVGYLTGAEVTMAEPALIMSEFWGHRFPVAAAAGIDSAGSSRPSILSVDTTGKIIFWNTETSNITWEAQLGSPSANGRVSIATSPDSKSAVIFRNNSPANIYNVLSGKVIQTLRVPDTATDETWNFGAFSPDSRRFAVISMDRDIRMFDVQTGLQTAALENPHDPENEEHAKVGFSRDGLFVVAFTSDAITVYDAITLAAVKSLPLGDLGRPDFARFSHDMRMIAIATDSDILIINAETLETMFKIKKHLEGNPGIAYTTNMEFDSQSKELHMLHYVLEVPPDSYYQFHFRFHYEIINTLNGRKVLSDLINRQWYTIHNPSDTIYTASCLLPSSKIVIISKTGLLDDFPLVIWKVPSP